MTIRAWLAAEGSNAPTDGLAGWTVDLMDRLGLFGAALAVSLDNFFPPIPSEIILPLAGFAASQGTFSLTGALVATTIGSVFGAIVLYWLGRIFGRDRAMWVFEHTPLLKVSDLERTEAWFAKHGGKAVFFGRMVPIVRSFISVPAGVVRMPLGQFLLFTAAGSLIWNSVLIGLGVAAGGFVRDNLKYLDYAVVAVVVLGVGWMVYRRVTQVYRGRTGRYGPGGNETLTPDDGADRPAT